MEPASAAAADAPERTTPMDDFFAKAAGASAMDQDYDAGGQVFGLPAPAASPAADAGLFF